MKLYYLPGACSLASHIALREAGLEFELDKLDKRTNTTASGEDYKTVTTKGYVPALRLSDGEVITESAVVLQYVADRNPDAKLAPAFGTIERYRLQEWLNYVGAELHKMFGAFFNPASTDDMKTQARAGLTKKLEWLQADLAGRDYLLGSQYSVADIYLFVVLNWLRFAQLDLASFPGLQAYAGRIAPRPAVQAALKAEGLLK